MRKFVLGLVVIAALSSASSALAAGKAEHIVVVVWDGMRPDFITMQHTPTLFQLAREGVMFQDHHSVYCTATEVNGTAMATGAYPANSGVIANNTYQPNIKLLGPVDSAAPEVIRKGDELSGGHYLLRPTLAEILQSNGFKTAIAGSKTVALLHDRHERGDDACCVNVFAGASEPPTAIVAVSNLLGAFPKSPDSKSTIPNAARDEWTTRALLDSLWSNGVPAFSLLWLSEPDHSQHAAGPGSPKALAALESSDRQLATVLDDLTRRELRGETDVFVVSDHGFSTVDKAVDVISVLQKAGLKAVRSFKSTPLRGDILVVGQGGSLLFYVTEHDAEGTSRLVEFLQTQEFTGVIFTREEMPGTFTLDAAHINSPNPPDVVLSMRWSAKKSATGARGLFYSEGSRKPGEGNHASLSRYDVHNTLVAAGPDVKGGFKDKLPTANTDLAPTILWLLGVQPPSPMDGRILSEALTVEAPAISRQTTRTLEASRPIGDQIWRQYLKTSQVNETVYLDEGNGSVSKR